MSRLVTLRSKLLVALGAAALFITPVVAASPASAGVSASVRPASAQHATINIPFGEEWVWSGNAYGKGSVCESFGQYYVREDRAINYNCLWGDPLAEAWNLWLLVVL